MCTAEKGTKGIIKVVVTLVTSAVVVCSLFKKSSKEEKSDHGFDFVIIDGSNVAYINDNGPKEAKLDRIKIVKNEAEKMTGKPVRVYVSAKLRYDIDRLDEFYKLKYSGEIIESPAGVDNDGFILQDAFRNNGLIITNDKLEDWKEANPDKADEIKQRRITFQFIDDKTVIFGGKLSNLKDPDQINA